MSASSWRPVSDANQESTPDLTAPPVACPPGPAARTVLMLLNRKAGASSGKRSAHAAADAIAAAGFVVERFESVTEIAAAADEAHRQGRLRVVIGAGGDGTLGALLNSTPPGTPLTILPQGTENLLAKYIQNTARPTEMLSLIEDGVVAQLDAGEANGRLFALMFSAGFDAEVVRRVHEQRRGNISRFTYAKPILDVLRSYQYPRLRVEWGGGGEPSGVVEGSWLFGLNLPRYARGLPIAPLANGLDGLIDLCVLRRGRTHAGIWYLWNILRRRHHKLRSVATARCTQFTVRAVDEGSIPYQLDGDPGGVLPVKVRVIPRRLSLLMKRGVAEQLGIQLSDRPA